MILHAIYPIATAIKSQLAQWCDRIEIAGSIRRARPECNDIDLVCLPKPGEAQAIRDRMKMRCRVVTDAPQTMIVTMTTGLQIDLWFAHGPENDLLTRIPGNFGTLYLCRTGSKEHNIKIAQAAHDLDLHWNPHVGLCDITGKVIASETEEDIFAALGMEFIPPVLREVSPSQISNLKSRNPNA